MTGDHARHLAVALAILAALAGALTACSGSGDDAKASVDAPTQASEQVPKFEGPYADDFAKYYSEATSEFVRGVLEDGKISDAEYLQMSDAFGECLADQGVEFSGFDASGGFMVKDAPNGADTMAIVDECSASSGQDSVGLLYDFMQDNPDNEDPAKLVAECLVEQGVVPADYSPDDYWRDIQGEFQDYSNLSPELQDALVECS